MDQMAAAAFAEEVARQLQGFAVDTAGLRDEIASAAAVQWESPTADAFRRGLHETAYGLPDAAAQLSAAAAELQRDPLGLASGS